MSDEKKRRVLQWQRQRWRRLWIAKFARRQRISRRWIAVVDLVDWCAESTTTATREKEAEAREVAYQRLTASVRKGEFESDGRSKILYLDAIVTSDGWSPRCRLTREQFEVAFDATATPPASSFPVLLLNCCWVQGELARRWLGIHGYRWPSHFDPASNPTADGDISRGVVAPVATNAKGGLAWPSSLRAKPRPPSREKKFWPAAHAVALDWLTENGCPAPGDGNQAVLERVVAGWLEDRNHEASESAVRRRVACWIKERRAELSA